MAHNYLKLGSINGPINASGSTAVGGGQPAGFSLDGVFDIQYSQTGVSSTAGSLFAQPGSSKAVAASMQLIVDGTARDPELFLAAAKGTVFPRACIIVAANATGGIASEWVRAYYLMQNVVITAFRTFTEGGSVYHDLALDYAALMSAWFATPTGGSLGARTDAGWDFSKSLVWNA